MAIKNIIFDFGGVLLDWNPRYFYKDIFTDESEMEYFLTEVCGHEWNLKQDSGYTFAEVTKEFQEQFPEYRAEIALYLQNWEKMMGGEIVENTRLLEPLKTNYRLFGLTNWSSEAFHVIFDKHPFFKYFEGIVVSGREKVVKPDKKIYELLLNRYGLAPDQSLFIDDNSGNIDAARELGFLTIHLNGNQSLEEHLKIMGLL